MICMPKKNNMSCLCSKLNSSYEKQVPNGEGWHYFAVKNTINIVQENNV